MARDHLIQGYPPDPIAYFSIAMLHLYFLHHLRSCAVSAIGSRGTGGSHSKCVISNGYHWFASIVSGVWRCWFCIFARVCALWFAAYCLWDLLWCCGVDCPLAPCVAVISGQPITYLALLQLNLCFAGDFFPITVMLLLMYRFHCPTTNQCRSLSGVTALALSPCSHPIVCAMLCIAGIWFPAFPPRMGTIDDQTWVAAPTIGDGACALHSVWGVWTQMQGRLAFYCEDARRKLLNEIPEDTQFLLAHNASASFREMLLEQTADIMAFAVARARELPESAAEERGSSHLWTALDESTREAIADHAYLKITATEDMRTREAEMLHAADPLFQIQHADMIRKLCVHLQYVTNLDGDKLGDIRVAGDGALDPLELFAPCNETPEYSRYQALFHPDLPECASIRKTFFLNVLYNATTFGHNNLCDRFDEFINDCLSQEQLSFAQLLQDVQIKVSHRHGFQPTADVAPELTCSTVWKAVQLAWTNEAYWFSVTELNWISEFCGPSIKLYRATHEGGKVNKWECNAPPQSMQRQDGECLHILLETDLGTGIGHFSRLLSLDEWSGLAADVPDDGWSISEQSESSLMDNDETDSDETSSDQDAPENLPDTSAETHLPIVDCEMETTVAQTDFPDTVGAAMVANQCLLICYPY